MSDINIDEITGNVKAFFKAFPDPYSFSQWKDENDNNLLHVLAEKSTPSFLKRVYMHYAKTDPAMVATMLIKRNNNNQIPAHFDFPPSQINPDTYRPVSAEDKKKYENYRFLKIQTKRAYYPFDQTTAYINSSYVRPGIAYENGNPEMPTGVGGKNGFTTQVPVYPTFHLVSHDYDERRTSSGFSAGKKRSTMYNNYQTQFFTGKIADKIRKKINHGEIVVISSVPLIDGVPLSKQLKDMMLFPEDYAFAYQAMDNVGAEIKKYHSDENMSQVVRNFAKDGGVIQIENTELKYMNSSGKTNDYLGLNSPIYRIIDSNNNWSLTSAVSINAKYTDQIRASKFSTLAHELTHHADKGYDHDSLPDPVTGRQKDKSANFSEGPIMGYAMALYAANKYANPEIYRMFLNVAKSYQPGHFNEEALANIMSYDRKDEFLSSFAKVFARYAEAKNNNDRGVTMFIEKQAQGTLQNREFIEYLFADFNKSNTSGEKMITYSRKYTNMPGIEKVIEGFRQDMDRIVETIDAGKRKTPSHTESYNRKINHYTQNDVNAAFIDAIATVSDCKNTEERLALLKKQREKVEDSGMDKLETFKLAVTVAAISKDEKLPISVGNAEHDFSSADSYRYIQNMADHKQMAEIVRASSRLLKSITDSQYAQKMFAERRCGYTNR